MDHALKSPIGIIRMHAGDGAITEVQIIHNAKLPRRLPRPSPLLGEAARQLQAYFAGKLARFDLPLAPEGNDFQKQAWAAIACIPYGETRSYGDIAFELASGPRAIGGACARNPIPLFIPCHRVLGAQGSLGGYSGGRGLTTKKFLLELEGARPAARAA